MKHSGHVAMNISRGFLRWLIALLGSFVPLNVAIANSIDSLHTQDDVRKFLTTNFQDKGIIFLARCMELSQAESNPIHRAYLRSRIDSTWVIDPATDKEVLVIHPADTDFIWPVDTLRYSLNYPFESVSSTVNLDFSFYKADIDSDGFTDMVVNTLIPLVVMHSDDGFEAHMFSDNYSSDTLSFDRVLTLPDGFPGLIFRRSPLVSDTARMIPQSFDTLVYRFHGFANYTPSFSQAGISKLVYRYLNSTGAGDHSECIEINRDGKCLFRYTEYDTVLLGRLDERHFYELENFVGYIETISIGNTFDDVNLHWDHDEGAVFIINFTDGTTKEIRIWGLSPTVGLAYLSRYLNRISKLIDWQAPREKITFACPQLFSPGTETEPADCCCGDR